MKGIRKSLFLGIVMIFFVFLLNPIYAWWDVWWDTTCETRYQLTTNYSSLLGPYNVNGTSGILSNGVNLGIVTLNTTNNTEKIYAYFDGNRFCGIANSSTEQWWENTTNIGGSGVNNLWDNISATGVWHFDKGSGTGADDSSQSISNDYGNLSGNTRWDSNRKVFGSYAIASGTVIETDEINTSTPIGSLVSNSTILNNFSVSIWVIPNGTSASTSSGPWNLEKVWWDNTATCCGLYYGTKTDAPGGNSFFFLLDKGPGNFCQYIIPSNNTWYNLVWVWNSTNLLAYVNGTNICVDSRDTDVTNLNGNFEMCNGFNGTCDEVRFYNRTISTDEIRQLYYMESNVSSLGPQDTFLPVVGNIIISPSNGTVYLPQNQINISGIINSPINGTTVFIEHDANNTLTNATNRTGGGIEIRIINNTAFSFWAYLVDLNASAHRWRVMANDSSDTWSNIETVIYNVSKAPLENNLTVLIDYSRSNKTITYGIFANISALFNASGASDLILSLYHGNNNFTSNNGTQFIFSAVANTFKSGTTQSTLENYTVGNYSSAVLTVNKNTTTGITISLNGTVYPIKWYNNDTIINITSVWNATGRNHKWYLTMNMTDSNSGWTNQSTESYFNISSVYKLITGNNTIINVSSFYNGTENYTVITNYTYIKIDMTPPRSYGFSPENSTSNLYNGTSGIHYFSISVIDNITETTNQSGTDKVKAELNGVNYSTTYSSNTGLSTIAFVGMSIGTHNIRWFANDTLNNQELLSIQSYSLTSSQIGGGGGGGGYVPPTVSFAIGDGICEKDKGETIELSEDCIVKKVTTEIPSLAKFYAFAIIASLIGIYYAQKQRTSKTKIKYR